MTILDKSKGKGTVVLLPSHQAMEKHEGCEGTAPRFLNLGNVWKWVVSFRWKEPSLTTGQEIRCTQQPVLDKEVWKEIPPLLELNTILSAASHFID